MQIHLILELEDGKVEIDPIDLDENASDEDVAEACAEEVGVELENADGFEGIASQCEAWGFTLTDITVRDVDFADDDEYGVK